MNLKALHAVVGQLCEIVDQLGSSFPAPKIVAQGDGYVDRHEPWERTNVLACYLKAVKICSTLNGGLVLLDNGHVQEAYALARIVQDQVDDIHFLVRPRGEDGKLSAHQSRALDEFFQEEFENPSDPVGTSQDRDRVPRPKIRGAIHREWDDPSTAQAISTALYRLFSGYVHGAYVHIMELHHADAPGHYHVRGSSAHLADAIEYFPNFIYQAILAVETLVDRSSRDDLLPLIQSLRHRVATEADVLPQGAAPIAE
jgi:hypothetical protein